MFKKDGTVTAANSSGRNDGAALLLVAEEQAAFARGFKPIARIVSQAAAGVSPDYMGMGPVPATRLALQRAGLTLEDIGLIELNEAFAAQALGVFKVLGLDKEKDKCQRWRYCFRASDRLLGSTDISYVAARNETKKNEIRTCHLMYSRRVRILYGCGTAVKSKSKGGRNL